MSHRLAAILLAAGAGLALADGSIVVLALPELLDALDTSVEGVAAVIGVYTAVLAVALLPAEALRRAVGARRLGAGGLVLFAAASLAAGLAGSLPLMLVLRAAQALGGAAALVAAFALLDAGRRPGGGGRLWSLAAIGGAAAGPALGGALTQALDWRAIFLVQVPIALAAAVAALRGPAAHVVPAGDELASAPAPAPGRRTRAAAALALVSAALTAVLFLLVLVLVAGWSLDPLAGAAAVTILPVTAIAATRIRGDATVRAGVGCLLVAGGVAALAALGTASVWWTVAPQVLAGVGMGLALPALGGALLPERTAADAARVLTLRHAGIAVALALLAPVIAGQLDEAVEKARERGAALVLDARLDPTEKLQLAPALVGDVNESDARGELARSFDERAGEFEDEERVEFERLRERTDQVLTAAVGDGFRLAFLLTAAFAALAALALLPVPRPAVLAVAAALAAAVPLGTWAVSEATAPEPVEIADPCQERELPDTGGISGFIQDAALVALDRAACRFGSSREELVLALSDEDVAREYEQEHGVDPRSLGNLVQGVLGF
ncbi:MAG: MFS transporter [Thermoleophilaceae bacterium]